MRSKELGLLGGKILEIKTKQQQAGLAKPVASRPIALSPLGIANMVAIQPKVKRILGFDPGLAMLGFGTICIVPPRQQANSPTIRVLDFGTIETPAKTPIGDRLCTIYEDLHALLDDLQPDLVALEKLFFYRMSNTITVAQARGVLMLVLAQKKLPYVEFTPAQVKQTLTGYGNAKKDAVQEAVARELSLAAVPKPDDAADALAIALTAWFYHL